MAATIDLKSIALIRRVGSSPTGPTPQNGDITQAQIFPRKRFQLDILMNIDIMIIMRANADPVTFAKALADDTRQEIMKHLCCVWLSVNDVVDKLDGKVNQPTVSHHLKKLEESGLVLVRQEGRQRFYSLNQEQFTVCCGLLVQQFAPDYAGRVIPINDIK